MKKEWDVIIIGGGPAGSTAARYSAKEGVSVLVLDGKKEIGSTYSFIVVCCQY